MTSATCRAFRVMSQVWMLPSLVAVREFYIRFFRNAGSLFSFLYVSRELLRVEAGNSYARNDFNFVRGPRGEASFLLFTRNFCGLRIAATKTISRRVFFDEMETSTYRVKGYYFLYFLRVRRRYAKDGSPTIVVSSPRAFRVSSVGVLFRNFLTRLIIGMPKVRDGCASPGAPLRVHCVRATWGGNIITSSLNEYRFVSLVRGLL